MAYTRGYYDVNRTIVRFFASISSADVKLTFVYAIEVSELPRLNVSVVL